MPRFKETPQYKKAVQIVRTLQKAGHETFLVGGCVRDLLMDRSPKDFDVATSARPPQVAKLFKKTIPVGIQFGVVLVVEGSSHYEVATFRTDLGYKDGRHPEGVRFSTPENDALRRDFTVNGLFYDPAKKKVIDFVAGREDIAKRLIRAIGDPFQRLEEDRLRMLRAVRFAANLDFEVDPKLFLAIQAKAKEIGMVSAERIRDELTKLFTGPHPARGLDLLDESGLLEVILPEVARMKGVPQPPEFHPEGDVFIHTRLLLARLKSPSSTLAFGALLHDVGKPPTFKIADRIRFDGHDRVGADMTCRILKRLRFSNSEIETIAYLVGNHMRFKDVQKMRLSTLKRFLSAPTFREEMKLHKVDCLASHGDLGNWYFLQKKKKEIPREILKPKPLISGRDLLALQFPQGPMIGVILRAVDEKQLEGECASKEQALTWVVREFKKPVSD